MSHDENLHWESYLPAGWRPLFRQLLADLHSAGISVRVTQAKEKFGELRVYIDRPDQAAAPLIAAAEQRSTRMCQECGAAGELMVGNYLYATLCEEHGAGFTKPLGRPMISLNLRYPKDD
ncbi:MULTISPECIES: hypothetical protein [unclassified Sphingobium]|uniref:hypothetical protein n=1 Tax=unclassified Sphingobium TaxID=2611147 RepID=UPI0005CB91F9|nr:MULTISPECIES: hypothetical protein [unclassified Sphingobium]AJR24402.1 hypothetical protein TZ53_12355 [Sphingobium sp. YBL2]AMK16816.1 hypothetical protein K663_02125 [Sphingobium sp. MI1205]